MNDREWLCHFCQKPAGQGSNYCSWDCSVAEARANGGVEHLPNGLPVRCIMHDGLMLEIEHGDHPDYMFPVEIEFIGEVTDDMREVFEEIVGRPPKDDAEVRYTQGDIHALIYTDGSVALTMSECCYAMWHVHTGDLLGGSPWDKGKSLTESSRAKILALGSR